MCVCLCVCVCVCLSVSVSVLYIWGVRQDMGLEDILWIRYKEKWSKTTKVCRENESHHFSKRSISEFTTWNNKKCFQITCSLAICFEKTTGYSPSLRFTSRKWTFLCMLALLNQHFASAFEFKTPFTGVSHGILENTCRQHFLFTVITNSNKYPPE